MTTAEAPLGAGNDNLFRCCTFCVHLTPELARCVSVFQKLGKGAGRRGQEGATGRIDRPEESAAPYEIEETAL